MRAVVGALLYVAPKIKNKGHTAPPFWRSSPCRATKRVLRSHTRSPVSSPHTGLKSTAATTHTVLLLPWPLYGPHGFPISHTGVSQLGGRPGTIVARADPRVLAPRAQGPVHADPEHDREHHTPAPFAGSLGGRLAGRVLHLARRCGLPFDVRPPRFWFSFVHTI